VTDPAGILLPSIALRRWPANCAASWEKMLDVNGWLPTLLGMQRDRFTNVAFCHVCFSQGLRPEFTIFWLHRLTFFSIGYAVKAIVTLQDPRYLSLVILTRARMDSPFVRDGVRFFADHPPVSARGTSSSHAGFQGIHKCMGRSMFTLQKLNSREVLPFVDGFGCRD
jgi:hypothetical protein